MALLATTILPPQCYVISPWRNEGRVFWKHIVDGDRQAGLPYTTCAAYRRGPMMPQGNPMANKGGLAPVHLTLCYRCAEYHVGWHVDWTRRARAG